MVTGAYHGALLVPKHPTHCGHHLLFGGKTGSIFLRDLGVVDPHRELTSSAFDQARFEAELCSDERRRTGGAR